jgi:hypothetical protein
VSEYQYYEFQALDKPLTSADQTYIRSLSSRVVLSATNAQFNYSYGDFRGGPEKLLERCFDLMLYIANFGTRQLLIRLPKNLVDPTVFAPYCDDHCISVSTTPKSVILDINLNTEDYYTWIEGDEQWLSGLVDLREELLKGDLRVLYLAWLRSGFIEDGGEDPEDMPEPPVPPNLKKLSPSLKNFADLFTIDQDLVAAAAEVSPTVQANKEPIEEWIAALPETKRNSYLVRVVQGDAHVSGELMQYLRQLHGSKTTRTSTTTDRTLADLIEIAKGKRKQRTQKERAAAATARRKQLEAIAPHAETLWQDIHQLIALKQAHAYDKAVELLHDLRDLAELQGTLKEFQKQIAQLKTEYSNRPGMLTRLQKAHLSR